jgi:hypothetical protein
MPDFTIFALRCVSVLCLSLVLGEGPTLASKRTAESGNFNVRSDRNAPPAEEVLERCERLRRELQRLWCGNVADAAWRPRCEIVLHSTRARYLCAVGRDGGQTTGSSLIRFDKRGVQTRRIDLLVDEQGGLPALPHELTHVVLADRFRGQPPRWVDEGIATMSDSVEKRRLHHRDCHHALRDGTALRVIDLLSLEQFSSAQQVPAFYGQSLSLIQFLVKCDEPGRIVGFAETARDRGYDHALKAHYGIDGVADLERKWCHYATTTVQTEAQPQTVPVSHRP